MKRIDRTTVQRLQADLMTVVESWAKKHGMAVTVDGMTRFTESDFRTKFRFALLDASGVNTSAQRDWARYAPAFGLPADGLGRLITWGGHTYTVVGIRPKAHRYPVQAERGGKRYGLPAWIFTPETLTPVDPANRFLK